MARRPFLTCGVVLAGVALSPALALAGDGSVADNARLRPGLYPDFEPLAATPAGSELYDPFFDVKWSVALRGAYQTGTGGQRFDAILAPDLTLTHAGTRSSIKFDANAEIQQPLTGAPTNLNALRLSLGTTYAIDRDTGLTAGANFSYGKPVNGAPGLAANIEIPPATLAGGGEATLTRQLGKFNVALRGSVTRTVYGDTTRTGGVVTGNADQNVWTMDGGLRLGLQITPIYEVFGEAGIGRDSFDTPNSSFSIKTDATRSSLQAGIKGQWTSVLEAQFSAGLGLRRFDEAGLGEVSNTLYNASLRYTPDRTWIYTGSFTTAVTPPGPGSAGTTKLDYIATGRIDRDINDWLAVHALANWHSARFEGSPETETGYGFGVGGAYKLTRHTALTADYVLSHLDSSSTGIEDNQTVTLGIIVAR